MTQTGIIPKEEILTDDMCFISFIIKEMQRKTVRYFSPPHESSRDEKELKRNDNIECVLRCRV